jgi:hypothetical protein
MERLSKLENVLREPNIVELKPCKSFHATITAPMIVAMGKKDVPDNNFSMGFAYIEKPVTLIDVAHKHPFDQWIFLVGADGKNFLDFGADVEFELDKKVYKINYSCYAFIPKGMYHCPLVIKKVRKPIVFIDARVTQAASVRRAVKKAR